jgi:hypothetical protein
LCPGPRIRRGSTYDTRCRGCKTLAGEPVQQSTNRTKAVDWAQRRANVALEIAGANAGKAGLELGSSWSDFAERFLIEVFDETCDSQPPCRFALAVAGSLARKQATPFSDLEFFFVVDDTADLIPFAKSADDMWKSIKVVHANIGSFKEDAFFYMYSPNNAVTSTGMRLQADPETLPLRAVHDPQRFDDFTDYWIGDVPHEMLQGSRITAGETDLLEALKKQTRRGKTGKYYLMEFKGRLRNKVLPDARDWIEGERIDVKEGILRTLLWITIYLGRYYGLHGTGDHTHLKRLLDHNKISKAVYKMTVEALYDAQAARFQSHMQERGEADEVKRTPALKKCFRTVSALLEMVVVWMRKKENKPLVGWENRNCFRTSHPERYDYFAHFERLRTAGWNE